MPPKLPSLRTLSPSSASALDADLTSTGGFTIPVLMELAGLAVAQAVSKIVPLQSKSPSPRILVLIGPGNNGGDGLVAARHLHHAGYSPSILYPKRSDKDLYKGLVSQLEDLNVPFLNPDLPPPSKDADESLPEVSSELKELFSPSKTDHVLDAIFGFSFKGAIRPPFNAIIHAMENSSLDVTAVDCPSGWNVEEGPPKNRVGVKYMPKNLVSLTAPKPMVKFWKGERHFVGGRFVSARVKEKFAIDVPGYQGLDQVVEVGINVEDEEGKGRL